MTRTTARNGVSTSRYLLGAGVGALILTVGAAGQDPASVDLTTVIRDFTQDHPDFDVIPADGYGYYHGLVAYDLDDEGKPVYSGGGFRDKSLWKDANGNPIAPHLFNTCGFLSCTGGGDPTGDGAMSPGLVLDEYARIENRSVVDSFDSNVGPYGEGNAGSAAVVRVNGNMKSRHYVRIRNRTTVNGDIMVGPDDNPDQAVRIDRRSEVTGEVGNLETMVDIPEIDAPEVGESVGNVRYRGGERTLSEDLHCETLKLQRHAVLNIEGDVTIMCDKDLVLFQRSEIRLMEDSTLRLCVGGQVKIHQGSKLNMNTGNPQLVSIDMLPADGKHGKRGKHGSRFRINGRGSQAAAWINGPETRLHVDNRAELFGSFVGRRLKVRNRAMFHVDVAEGTVTDGGGGDVVCTPSECDLGDTPGVILTSSLGDISSSETFSEWWRDVLGVNMTTVKTITLTRNSSGEYSYINDNYRPIDGELLGNEGQSHNYHLTVELDTTFDYDGTPGQWMEIRCTDDTYVFINGRLVLDLGGYGFNKVMYIDMDRLGLDAGETHQLQIFHAQRQQGLGIFRIRTNLVLADNSAGAGTSVNGILDD